MHRKDEYESFAGTQLSTAQLCFNSFSLSDGSGKILALQW